MTQRINHCIELPFLFNESILSILDESKKSESGARVSLAVFKKLILDVVRDFGIDICENDVSGALLCIWMEDV